MSGEVAVGWVCNLAAEFELIDPAFVPSAALAARVDQQARRFLKSANVHCAGRVRHLDLGQAGAGAEADVGVAWLPTPAALRHLECTGGRRGSERPPALAVLQRVNHRRFALALGGALVDAVFVDSLAAFERHLGSRPFPPGGYLLKRPFSFSGRGRKRLMATDLGPSERRWVEASMTEEYGFGLVVEPFVSIQAEFSLHGFLPAGDRPCVFGRPVAQVVDPVGAWVGAALARQDSLAPSDRQALYDAGESAARALREQGYHGAFSCDAYRYDESGASRFCAMSELNARYSMGFFVGFEQVVEAWLEALISESNR